MESSAQAFRFPLFFFVCFRSDCIELDFKEISYLVLLLHSLEVLAKYDTHQSEVNTFPKILLGNLPLTQSDITAIEFGSL